MIPKIIWQTHEWEYKDLPLDIKKYTDSWKEINPGWEYKYMSNQERKNFIIEYFGDDWLSIYNSYPFNVMKADLWRYLVILVYGGVYVDIDTVCKKELDSWVNQEYDFIVSTPLKDNNVCQFIFAANKNTEIIKCLLKLIKEEYQNQTKYNKKYQYIASNTGYIIWNKAIKQTLKINDKLNFSESIYKMHNVSVKAKESKFYCYGGKESALIHKDSIEHLIGGINWNYDGHEAWQKKEWEADEQ